MARAMCMAVAFLLATAACQANGCANESECPSDAKPKNLWSLLQTKLRIIDVLGGGPSMVKNPSAMLTDLEAMVRSGETPAFDLITTVKTLILDEIMPSLKSTQEAAYMATTDALRSIQSCNNASRAKEDNIAKNKQMAVENARSLHAACREAEKVMYYHNLTNSDSYCVRLGKFLHGAKPLEIASGSIRDSSVQYVKWACSTNMCSHTEVTELDNGCSASEAELADKKNECSAAQRSFESEFCAWKGELESNCKDLDTCHSAAVTAYNNHVSKTRTLVEKWNVETAALQKILCYCSVWLSEGDPSDDRSKHDAAQFEICKDQTHSPQSVDYGTPEAKVPCLLTSVANHPGTSGFITQEYDNFTDFVGPVHPCAGVLSAAADSTIQALSPIKEADSTMQALSPIKEADCTVEFNATSCSAVYGTFDIHWKQMGASGSAPQRCTAIEYTKVTIVSNTTLSLNGTHVSDDKCIGPMDRYHFTLDAAALTMSGMDKHNFAMQLCRTSSQRCFVGHWVSGSDDYLAHISAHYWTRHQQ